MFDRSPPEAGLPAPTGRYRVGRLACHWPAASGDDARPPPRGGGRELVAWIWYPAEPGPDARPAVYLPEGWEQVGQFWGFRSARARAHAYEDAPVAVEQDHFPVLVFSPAGMPPCLLTALLEEVASHGYIVVGVNHTHESTVTVFPDGRIVPMDAGRMRPVFGPFSGSPEETMRGRAAIADEKAADLHFVVDQLATLDASPGPLAGRLDLTRLGAFGHSLGGNAALAYGRLDDRCKAAANLDGGLWNAVGEAGLDRPTLLIMAEHAEMALPCTQVVRLGVYPTVEWCEAERGRTVGGWQTVYEHGRPGYAVLVRGSGHISFLDMPFLPIEPGSMMAGGLATVRIDSRRAWRIISDYLVAFFDRHLRGAESSLLDQPSPAHPEAILGEPTALLAGTFPAEPAPE